MRPFERRIYYGIAIVIFSCLPMIGLSFFTIHKVFDEERNLISGNAEELAETQQLRYLNSSLASILPVYVLDGDPKHLEAFDKQSRHFDALTSQMLQSEANPEARALLLQIKDKSWRLRELLGPGVEMRKEGVSIHKVHDYFERETKHISTELADLLRDLAQEESNEFDEAQAQLSKTVNWMMGGLVFISCLAVILLIISYRLITGAIRQKRAFDEAQDSLFRRERQLSQARKEAVEVVAHDLKNPLSTLKMSLELLQDEIPPDLQATDLRGGLEIGRRSVESMENLIRNLLDHAKIEAGGLPIEKRECDLAALAKDLIERFQTLAKQKDISLTAGKLPRELRVNGDPGRLEQVLSNLIGNALKFTPEHGTVRVEGTRHEGGVQISVEDNGPGIAKDAIPRIFDRFWQVKETSKQGSGLGLSIAKAIIEAHQGRIWVESEKGRGSKFYFLIPGVSKTVSPPLPAFRDSNLDWV